MGLTGQAVYTAVEVALGVSCVLGNALTIGALVWSTKRSREPQPSGTITTTSTVHSLLSSLAVADMLVGGLAIPLAVGVVDGRLEMSSRACLLASCLLILPTLASVMSLLAIAVDRYLRVYAPLRLGMSLYCIAPPPLCTYVTLKSSQTKRATTRHQNQNQLYCLSFCKQVMCFCEIGAKHGTLNRVLR